jgi:hypothetical protein
VTHYDADATYRVDDFSFLVIEAGPAQEEARSNGPDTVTQVLLPYWQQDSRHALSLALSGFLAKAGWPWAMVLQVLESLAERCHDEEPKDRHRACRDTFTRFREGRPVEGFRGLRELVTAADLERLEELAHRALVPPDMQRIDSLRQVKKIPAFLRHRSISTAVIAALREDGRFLRCSSGQLHWFQTDRRRVLPLEEAELRALLDSRFGLNAVETESRYVLAALETETLERGENAEVYRTAFWQADENRLFVDAGGGRVYLLNGRTIATIGNGENGVFFTREPWQAPFTADLDNALDPRRCLVDDLNFARGEGVCLGAEEQALTFHLWLRSLFFTEAQPTRPLLTLVGDSGSGKTSAQRRVMVLLEGIYGDVHQIGREDAFDAALCANHLVVLDNVDERVDWLANALCRASTGAAIKKRELYTTNREVVFFPRAFVALTSKHLPFHEETVGDRLLVLRLARREEFLGEGEVIRRVLRERPRIWAGLLRQLNRDVGALTAQPSPPPVKFRLADWAGLAVRLEPTTADLLPKLEDEQANTILVNSSLPPVIDAWLQAGGKAEWLPARQLFAEWQPIAEQLNEHIGRTARGLAQRLSDAFPALSRIYDCGRRDGGEAGLLYRFQGRRS